MKLKLIGHGALGSYYSKLEVSAFIGIGTGTTDLNHYFQGT